MSVSGDLTAIFQDGRIHRAWEAVYRRDSFLQAFHDQTMARLARYLRLPPDSLVLDAGCGTGEHTLRLARLGLRCVGVDVSQPALRQAEDRARASPLAARIRFGCEALEKLSFPAGTFDAVHCRGVLMHVPRWEQAVAELARVLKPGGRIVLLENNHRALEMHFVRLLRLLRTSESRIVTTRGGDEFWIEGEKEGEVPLTRVANIRALARELGRQGIDVRARLATEFWDVNRFPPGLVRNLVRRFNQLWFGCRLPAAFSMGNALIGEKTRGRVVTAEVLAGGQAAGTSTAAR